MRPGPGQHLYSAFHDLIAPFRDSGTNTTKFTIHWISAHSEVVGNEKVDEEAKSAAQGASTARPFLPDCLKRPLPIGKSSLLQLAKEQRTENWKASWLTSPRRKKMKKIDKDFPFKKFGKITSELTRRQTSILVQLRTGHLPLNDYLHKRKLAPSPLCQACNEQRRETINHLIKECPAYQHQRRKLKRAIHGRGLSEPLLLLSDPKRVKPIIQFIEETKRWTNGRMTNPTPS
ncbi:hypothetical protein D9613_004855 [Agrocybe pediades]|uniref:RNase H type-1 domain-containing protein n=1 Tax=Agrocybe pediades TaxID=84607 RepID=A0A8H4VQR6_9AGAR|nr:hypothetical protein D9613_004855 [Agrocybe pediades]